MRIATAILAATTLLAGAAPAWSAPRSTGSPPAPVPAQAFSGGGSGSIQRLSGEPEILDGTYTSTGQLGNGRFHVEMTGAMGFARFVRDDGMRMTGAALDSSECATGPADTFCIAADVAGSSDVETAHVVLAGEAVVARGGTSGLTSLLFHGTLTRRARFGYVMVDPTGTTYAFGGVDHHGDAGTLGATAVALTPSGDGYWVLNAIGQVAAFGDAQWLGNAFPATPLPGETVITLAPTPTGNGYWIFTSRGRVFPFGDAQTAGDLASSTLNAPIVGAVATPTGRGYTLVAADGGVFAFGDARFHGSMGGAHLNRPVVGIASDSRDAGYWLVAADGGVFAFGDAPFHASLPLTGARAGNVVGIVRYGDGYLLLAADGGVFDFSSAPFFGSLPGRAVAAIVADAAATG